MDINTQNSSGMMNGIPPTNQQHEKKVGPIVGALIIVLILIIAALYFFGQKLNTQAPSQQTTTQTPTENANMANSSSSLNPDVMKADLDAQLKDVDYSF